MKDTLRLTNDTSETPLLGEWVEKIGERMDLPTDKVFGLNLALEEAVVNVMNYAYPEQKGMPIYLAVDDLDGALRFVLEDEGLPFDPTSHELPDITLGAEDRPIGGLGIFLVTQLMSRVEYQRVGNRNRLTMIM
ncbi:MAG: ATP-binding protein [Bacteroidaceae bacterium]|nr:ATP-binding protein [Bacteroidaceae bacterium]